MVGVHQGRERGFELHKRIDNSPAGRILRGAIDGHIHFAPDIQPRRFTAIEAALAAREMGLRAIVIKNHSYPTGPLASMISEIIPEIAVFGGICLGHEVSGLLYPNVPEGMRMFTGSMLKYGLSEEDVTYMVKPNPARLLRATA